MRAVRTLVVFAAVAAIAACGKSKSNATLAKLGNESITAEQVNKEAAKRLDDVEQRFATAKAEYHASLYQAKLGAIENIVNQKLFEEMGKEKGITGEQAREQKFQEFVAKIPVPSEDEQRQVYEQVKQQQAQQGQQIGEFEEVQQRIIETIRARKAGPEAEKWYEEYKKQHGFKLLLEPYRQEIDATGPSKGAAKAPVTIVEFSDFQCPYCSRAEPTLDEVMKKYGDKVRLVFRDFPLDFHPLAQKASEAAQCADAQGKFWEMHKRLFADQSKLEVPDLKAHAKELGLDTAKFDKCLDQGEKAPVVAAHYKAGRLAGVQATPAFFINGRPIAGALPFEEFQKIIDEELAR